MKCNNNDCQNNATGTFLYCSDCYAKWKASQPTTDNKNVWADDKYIDQLMKINANLGSIARQLERMNRQDNYDDNLTNGDDD